VALLTKGAQTHIVDELKARNVAPQNSCGPKMVLLAEGAQSGTGTHSVQAVSSSLARLGASSVGEGLAHAIHLTNLETHLSAAVCARAR
jgi:hypothetical protein